MAMLPNHPSISYYKRVNPSELMRERSYNRAYMWRTDKTFDLVYPAERDTSRPYFIGEKGGYVYRFYDVNSENAGRGVIPEMMYQRITLPYSFPDSWWNNRGLRAPDLRKDYTPPVEGVLYVMSPEAEREIDDMWMREVQKRSRHIW